ncbi:uncharacterized protein LOC124677438 [Lolium rigidum]|uniref:uncharacterized protein LOC124677438 n=1 Tax=Lolium rigidum TaxID=89674 RepID=UPI001F5D211C|nr:uncharacterized protein LOC124677438 [Lolium rigidum]
MMLHKIEKKAFVLEQETTMSTYKCMKVGAKQHIDDYEKGLKSTYPEDWKERDLDPAVLYSTGGGMLHGWLPIGDGAFRKSQVVGAANRSKHKTNKLHVVPRAIFLYQCWTSCPKTFKVTRWKTEFM